VKGLLVVMGTCVAVLATGACASRPKRDPEQSHIRYELAVGYFRDRRVEAALEELQKALESDPQNADAHHMLGIIALNQGHDYLVQLETASCLKGRDAELVRADATRKFRDAQQSLNRAVTIQPELSTAWNNLSVAALALQEWDEAIQAARNALKNVTYAEPEVARANLGWAYFHKGELQNAWKELHEAVSRAPGFCVGHYRLAKVYVERGDAERAAEELEPVLATGRCPIQEASLLGGLVHERRKDRERAKTLFDRCITMAPRSCVADQCRRYAQLIQ
jgi:type IV pilus assembly protein PilF